MSQPSTALEFVGVDFYYPRSDQPSVHNVSVAIPTGSFVLLVGPTGSGKSTLLRLARGLHKESGGVLKGSILLKGHDLLPLSPFELGSQIAIVFQNPAYQLHQPRVIDEIISAPMYQSLPWSECLQRAHNAAEGILDASLLSKEPNQLSSGQQQKVALAATLAMKADILLLDEPFSYLDAQSTQEFIELLKTLKEKRITIILATHDLDPVAELADRIILMDRGEIPAEGSTRHILYGNRLATIIGRPLFVTMGHALLAAGLVEHMPLSLSEVASVIRANYENTAESSQSLDSYRAAPSRAAIRMLDVSFSYADGAKVLDGVSLDVFKGDVFGLVGANGSGKTTLAMVAAGLLTPTTGRIEILGDNIKNVRNTAAAIGYVTQDPRDMLFETTVERDCRFGPMSLNSYDVDTRVNAALSQFYLLQYSDRDPLSLSGGQQRLLTFADVMVNDPDILVLDEPEFGLDLSAWRRMVSVIKNLQGQNKTVIVITHKTETALLLCNRVALLANGRVIATGESTEILTSRRITDKAGLVISPLAQIVAWVQNGGRDSLARQALNAAIREHFGTIGVGPTE